MEDNREWQGRQRNEAVKPHRPHRKGAAVGKPTHVTEVRRMVALGHNDWGTRGASGVLEISYVLI